MISRRRCAQFGLILACFTLFTMLTVLFFGSYEFTPSQNRVGTVAKVARDKENTTPHIDVASMAK